MTHDPLLHWREEFPILSACNYLISNSLGAMPRGVYERLRYYADTWAEQGVSAWGTGWFELPQTVGDKIAPLMGAAANSVLVHQNASIANSILFGALDFSDRRRDKVVDHRAGFPQRCLRAAQLAAGSHADSDAIRSRDGIHIDIDELLDAIDESTRLVSTSHVLFRSAFIMPARAITEKAHQRRRASPLQWLSQRRRHSGGCRRLGCRLLHRRRAQVALRRTGRRLHVCAP